MRLLFDQNLAPRLSIDLADLYPDSAHVRHVGLERANDDLVWRYAKAGGFAIVTKDDDFRQLSVVFGPPPKVMWLWQRTGSGLGGTDADASTAPPRPSPPA